MSTVFVPGYGYVENVKKVRYDSNGDVHIEVDDLADRFDRVVVIDSRPKCPPPPPAPRKQPKFSTPRVVRPSPAVRRLFGTPPVLSVADDSWIGFVPESMHDRISCYVRSGADLQTRKLHRLKTCSGGYSTRLENVREQKGRKLLQDDWCSSCAL